MNMGLLDVSPEPEPEFTICREEWGLAWPTHTYIFALLFLFMTVYNVNSTLGLLRGAQKTFRRKKIFILINLLLFFFNFITSFHLFVDPYDSKEHFEIKLPGLFFILFGLRIPCLTASFSLIEISLLETTKIEVYSKKLQDIRYFFAIITTHFVVVVAVHIYLTFNPEKFQLIVICQLFFVAFGTVISVCIIYTYFKIRKHIIIAQRSLNRSFIMRKKEDVMNDTTKTPLQEDNDNDEKSPDNVHLLKPKSPFFDKSLRKLLKIVVMVAASAILCCISIMYSTISMLVKSSIQLQPWPWLIFQTVSRIGELGMVFGMSYLVRRSIFATCVAKIFR